MCFAGTFLLGFIGLFTHRQPVAGDLAAGLGTPAAAHLREQPDLKT